MFQVLRRMFLGLRTKHVVAMALAGVLFAAALYLPELWMPILISGIPFILTTLLFPPRNTQVFPYLKKFTWGAWIAAVTWWIWVVAQFHNIPSQEPLLFTITVASIVLLVVLWIFPKWQISRLQSLKPEEQFNCENEARKTLAQIFAGIAILAGFYSAQQQLLAVHEGQVTERYSKAVDQLGATDEQGHKKLEIRLGAIYALERIARESEKDSWPIIEILTAYVRQNSPRKPQEPVSQKHEQTTQMMIPELDKDIQAILSVIARRRTTYEGMSHDTRAYWARTTPSEQQLDLRDTDLRNLRLGEADARVINLNRSWANDLNSANLSGANLEGADLSHVNLANVNFKGAYLRRANLA